MWFPTVNPMPLRSGMLWLIWPWLFGAYHNYFFQFYISPKMFSCTPEGTRTQVEDHCIRVELNSLWLLTCFHLPGDLNKQKRKETFSITVSLYQRSLWCPALIHSNEWSWRQHNRGAKAVRNWLQGNSPLHLHLYRWEGRFWPVDLRCAVARRKSQCLRVVSMRSATILPQ
jgi:hypothetical protein